MDDKLTITDPEAKRKLAARLARIEGQVRGLQDMIEREEDCEQIAQQLTAVRMAFSKVFAEMVADEIEALESGQSMSAGIRHARLSALIKILSKYG